MKRRLRSVRLEDYGDALRIPEVCAVLQISQAQYFALKKHHAFPIPPLPSLGGAVRYSKTAVAEYLQSSVPSASGRTRPRSTAGLEATGRFPRVAGVVARGL